MVIPACFIFLEYYFPAGQTIQNQKFPLTNLKKSETQF